MRTDGRVRGDRCNLGGCGACCESWSATKGAAGRAGFPGVGHFRLQGFPTGLISLKRKGGERQREEREAISILRQVSVLIVLILDAVIPSMPNPRSSSPSLASGVSYQTHGPKKQNSEKKRVSLRPPRDCAAGSDDRPPTPKNGGLATGSAGLAVQALVPGVQACVSRRSAIEARGDQRRHACPCIAFDCHADGFPATIPAKCSFQLCSFRGSSRHHLGG